MLRVHSYESLGTYDGPGIRLVVFLQGCNFRCLYCANPDTIDAIGESTLTDPHEILQLALSQRPFFGKRGGVTFSGGEPTLQAQALVPLVRDLKAAGIHVALDTNGSVMNRHVEELLSLVDLVLLDLKEPNDTRHCTLTQHSNAQTLRTAAWLQQHHKPMWLRYVLVQGYSAFDEDLHALGQALGHYTMIERVEILPYHTLGVHKYEAMDLKYMLPDVRMNTDAELQAAQAILRQYFTHVYVN